MKKKILCMILSIAVVFSFMPLFTIQAEAFSTGSKTLVKTKTVTISPGKTYKTPVFKISKKMTFQVPIEIFLSTKDKKNPEYIKKGGFTLTLKNSKGKKEADFSDSLVYTDKGELTWYDNWIYFYKKSISKPLFNKGKYYFTIKNTTNRIIRVTYSVKAYTKFATSAEFPKTKTMEPDSYQKLGKIGPGIPAIKSIVSSNKSFEFQSYLKHNGTLSILPYGTDKDINTTLTITLKKNNKKYKVKLKVKAIEDGEEDYAE